MDFNKITNGSRPNHNSSLASQRLQILGGWRRRVWYNALLQFVLAQEIVRHQ